MPDTSRIAVEVTSHTAGNRAAFASELGHRNPIMADSLRLYWQVDINVPVERWADHKSVRPLLDQIEDELEEILLQVERDELFEEVGFVRPGSGSSAEHPLRRRLRDLNIVAVKAVELGDGGEIWLQPPYLEPFSFNPNDIARAAGAHVEPNLKKLLAAKSNGAGQAHLFVWLPPGIGRNPGASAATRGILEHERVTVSIDLQGLDAVWITSSGRHDFEEVHGHRVPVYRYDQHGWHKYILTWGSEPA
ncbi:hypothetical protein [Candidatus Poriferisodalis sp.]|uniref:hypothetical protein n=1 Tax=Candidatus Poriferisodalis sp. TaxID=3101277 RepID=UPI003B59F0C3